MNHINFERQVFGSYDRICIGSATYRYVRQDDDGKHILQLLVDGLLQNDFRRITDKHLYALKQRKNFKVEHGYFARALDELRARQDDSHLLGLSEEALRTVMWKTEWCVRFHTARRAAAPRISPKMTHEGLAAFIEQERESMNRWYIRQFSEPRRIGRPVKVGATKEPKPYDYPSPTTLRNWLRIFATTGERMVAFAPRYHRCGNRSQLDSELAAAIDKCVRGYADLSRPTRKDIYDQVEIVTKKLNIKRERAGLPALPLVSPTTVNRRIAKLEPFFVDAGRLGPERAMRRYLPVGMGARASRPLERVEIDDWEADLHAVMATTQLWTRMTKAQRAAVPRVRCTVTVAIDCCTRCIVGINVSENAPSTPGAKAALKSITEDKSHLARYAGARRDWPFYGRPDDIFRDGGPVFAGEFAEAMRDCGLDPTRPDPDPRQRGTIEAFFRYLRRACRFFTGQTFSNVVQKGDYPSEETASLTVEEFRRYILRFIVDVYHERGHRGLAGETPRSAWERLTAKYGEPATITSAQRRLAFGFKHTAEVRNDAQGMLYLGISYGSEHLAELLKKMGTNAKLPLVIDPDNLGDVFVQVPLRFVKHMQKRAPIEMHGEFLEVPAIDRRFKNVTLAEHLIGNQAVREFVKKSQEEGKTYRISANEALGEAGIRAARRIGLPIHALTAADYEKLTAKFRVLARQATAAPAIGDAAVAHDATVPGGGHGKVVSTSKRTRPVEPPEPHQAPVLVNEPHQAPVVVKRKRKAAALTQTAGAPPTQAETPTPERPSPALVQPSRSVNDGDDD